MVQARKDDDDDKGQICRHLCSKQIPHRRPTQKPIRCKWWSDLQSNSNKINFVLNTFHSKLIPNWSPWKFLVTYKPPIYQY